MALPFLSLSIFCLMFGSFLKLRWSFPIGIGRSLLAKDPLELLVKEVFVDYVDNINWKVS